MSYYALSFVSKLIDSISACMYSTSLHFNHLQSRLHGVPLVCIFFWKRLSIFSKSMVYRVFSCLRCHVNRYFMVLGQLLSTLSWSRAYG